MRPAALPLAPGSRAAVASYARRNPWIGWMDLSQEAALAIIRDHAAGTMWEAHVVGLALSRFVAEARVPVSLPKRKGESWKAAAASTRLPLVRFGAMEFDGGETLGCFLAENSEVSRAATEHWDPMEDRLDAARAVAEVRRILDAESEAAKAVLLEREKSASVAKRLGVTVAEVYADTANAMRRLRRAFAGWEMAA